MVNAIFIDDAPRTNPKTFSPIILLDMKKFRTNVRNFSCGDPSGIRTPDTLLKRQVLCQLS